MNKTTLQLDRVFLRTQYALHYRRASRARLESEARAGYFALFLLRGKLRFKLGEDSFESEEGDALLLDPGVNTAASGRDVEYLLLTLSPSFILERAALAGMVGAGGSSVSFRVNLVEQDKRLARFARD